MAMSREMDLVDSADGAFHEAVQDWIQRGEQIPLSDVPYVICYIISSYFPPQYKTWRKLASELYDIGLQHLRLVDIEKIEGDAQVHQKWSSLVLLHHCSTELNLSFSDVLTVLYKRLNRLDCLNGLYKTEYVPAFLKFIEHQMTLPSSHKAQQNQNIHSGSPFLKKQSFILLTYSTDVNTHIPTLVQQFRNAGIAVMAECEMHGKMDYEKNRRDAWQRFFKQCKYVVPIVSPRYLRDIQSPSKDDQASWVRFVYDLYTWKYVNDGCLNYVVRPLVMANVKWKHLKKNNPTLLTGWRWDEHDDFIAMIKRCAK